MLKILPAIGAVAIIAFSIGFNTVRYPIVWEMVGPSAHLPEQANSSEQTPDSNQAASSQTAKSAEPIASISNTNPLRSSSSDNFSEKSSRVNIVRSETKLPVGTAPAVSSPAFIPALQTAKPDLLKTNVGVQMQASPFSEQAVLVKAEPIRAESSPPMTNLVPVPSDLFVAKGAKPPDQYPIVQRLPPIYQVAPMPAGRYAAEYPQSPITIYPSTGK